LQIYISECEDDMPQTGEQIQAAGAEGAQRAKIWLESTCRAEVKWNNPKVGVKKLQFKKAGAAEDSEAPGDYFSFDLGGNILGDDSDGDLFLAEAKKYSLPRDQGPEYREFVSKCYLVESELGPFYDHYLWITWAPFLSSSWNTLLTPEFVKSAVHSKPDRKYIALGTSDYQSDIGEAVATKLMILVLSDRQEILLALQGSELMHVRKALLELRTSA
jgi:hypothetical protein